MSTQGGPPPTQPLPPGTGAYPAPEPGAGGRFERAPQQPGYEQPGGYYGEPQPYGHHDQGPGFAERAGNAAGQVARQWRTPETKEFWKTSEFLVGALTSLLVLAAAAIIGGGGGDGFTGDRAWLYVTILASAYMLSRGLSKAGTRRGREDHDRW